MQMEGLASPHAFPAILPSRAGILGECPRRFLPRFLTGYGGGVR